MCQQPSIGAAPHQACFSGSAEKVKNRKLYEMKEHRCCQSQKKSLRKRLQRLRIGQQLLFLTVGNWDTKEFTAFEMLDSWRAGVGGSND